MSNARFDLSDLIIPVYDASAKTCSVVVDVHPGQVELLDHFAGSTQLGLGNRGNVMRWCIAWGTHTLLTPLPRDFALLEAKMNVLHHERWNSQKHYLADSVAKSLARGEKENARRLVVLAFEEYSHIPIPYWKQAWLSTLEPAIQMLEQHGIRLDLTAKNGRS